MYEINRFRRLSHAFVHFVMDRASLFTDHRISGRPILAKYKHFRTILGAYLGQFSNRFHFFFSEMMVIDAWSRYFVELLNRIVCQLTISFHTFLDMTIHIVGPRGNMKSFRVWFFSAHSAEIRDSNMVL